MDLHGNLIERVLYIKVRAARYPFVSSLDRCKRSILSHQSAGYSPEFNTCFRKQQQEQPWRLLCTLLSPCLN